MTRDEAAARLRELCKKPPPEFSDWGVVRTGMWVEARKRSARYLKRRPQLRTSLREIAALEGVATAPLPLDVLPEV